MRILHTSDWHLGVSLHNASLIEDQDHFIHQLDAIVQEHKIDVVFIAGDVFDHAVSNPEALALYNKAMTLLCLDRHVKVIIAAGNHDGAARLASCNALLQQSGLHIVGKISGNMLPLIIDGHAFHILPYFSIDEVRYLYPAACIKSYADAMGVLTAAMRQTRGEGRNILLAHCFVTGAELSESDRSAAVGGSSAVPLSVFEGFDYVALGHLHRAQSLSASVRYSGTPIKYSFAEAAHQKSVTILDTEDLHILEVPLPPLRKLRELKGGYEELLEAAKVDADRDAYVRIVLTDCCAALEKMDAFRNFYPNLLSFAGLSLEGDTQSMTLTVNEIASLSEEDILLRFCQDNDKPVPDEELLRWFNKAVDAVKKEDGVQ